MRAKTYEVRVYEGKREVRNLKGIKQLSCACKYLEEDHHYTWKVRGRNASGPGPWSRTRSFFVDPTLWGSWGWLTTDDLGFLITREALWTRDNRKYQVTYESLAAAYLGKRTEKGTWTGVTTSSTTGSIRFTNRLETWEPASGDLSGIAAYQNKARPNRTWTYTLSDWTWVYSWEEYAYMTMTVIDEHGSQITYHRNIGATD